MGTGAFIFASNFSDQGIAATGLMGPIPALLFILTRVIIECRYKKKNNRWTKEKNSRLLKEDGTVRWSTLVPLIGNVLTNALYLFAMTIGWKLAKASGLNQGVISTLLSCASVFNMIIFYFKFGEKISAFHFIGVALMIACVLCISMAAASGDDEEKEDIEVPYGLSKTAAGILSVCCGLFSAIMMSTKHLLIRLYKKTFSGIAQGIDSSILEFILYSVFLIPLAQQEDFTLGIRELAIGAAAGTLIGSARIMISIGVSIGLAAPAQSLMSTHALH